jgi:tetratricopeptide (TPR) repeat protein
VLQDQGDLSSAKAMLEDVLAVQRRVSSEEHEDTFTTKHALARVLYDQGDLSGAKAMFEEVLAVERLVLGDEHDDTLTTMHALARVLQDQGDLSGAKALFEQVLNVERRVLGERHTDIQMFTQCCFGDVLRLHDRLDEAQELVQGALDVLVVAQGNEGPFSLLARHVLALIRRDQGRIEESRVMLESIVEIETRDRSATTINCLQHRFELGVTLSKIASERERARQVLSALLIDQTRVLGTSHFRTIATETKLNELRQV